MSQKGKSREAKGKTAKGRKAKVAKPLDRSIVHDLALALIARISVVEQVIFSPHQSQTEIFA